MIMIQFIFLPAIIIVPAFVFYLLLNKIRFPNRQLSALIGGITGGAIFSEFFITSMHFSHPFMAFAYFGMIGGMICLGLFNLKRRDLKRFYLFLGFFLASLFVFYLVFFDIRSIAFITKLDFINYFFVIWLINLFFILFVGYFIDFIYRRIKK
jgi:hypothetical protein